MVTSMAVAGTSLYVGGFFSRIGGINASNLAKWDGTNWSAMEPRFDTLGTNGFFAFTWVASALPAGFHSWTVRAVDDQGDTNLSSPLRLVIVSSTQSPSLIAAHQSFPGAFRLGLLGQTDRAFFLQGSTDLVSWSLLTTNRFVEPLFDFLDERPGPVPQQFYRAFYGP